MGVRPRRDLNKTIDIPGPGQYSPDLRESKISFS
jgi:hypothetical protein